MSNLSEAIQEMRNMREAYDQIGAAAESYNTGKELLVVNIEAKGVTASASESLPALAAKVGNIAQHTYTIDGGEMYAKQLCGSLTTPNYWNLYKVLADLLTDGNVPEWNESEQTGYGGIMLAQYYKGYASFAFDSSCSAGAGGGYVFSDEYRKWKAGEIATLPIQTTDAEHFWDDDNDGHGDRWIAFLFAGENHGFTIADTNRCPRAIYIGRKVGAITSNVNGRVSELVVPDGNSLADFDSGNNYTQNWGNKIVLRNLKSHSSGKMLYIPANSPVECVYVECEVLSGGYIFYTPGSQSGINTKTITFIGNATGGYLLGDQEYLSGLSNIILKGETLDFYISGRQQGTLTSLQTLSIFDVEYANIGLHISSTSAGTCRLYIGYKTNDKTKSVTIVYRKGASYTSDMFSSVELKQGWCKPLDISKFTALTKENVQTYIFDRLGVNDLSTGTVTITLASAVLALFTQEEIDAVVARTNITIVGA